MNDLAIWMAIISTLLAGVATWYAARSTRVAQKSLDLAQQQERRQQPKLNLYLAGAQLIRNRSERFRVYAFHLRINNISDADNSLAEMVLVIEHSRNETVRSSVILSHDPSLVTELATPKYAPFQIPSAIGAHETLAGCALFRIRDELLNNSTIEGYLLKAIDSHGEESSIEPIFVNEYRSEDKKEEDRSSTE